MEVIDITLRHLDLRQLRLGADDDTAVGGHPPAAQEPIVAPEQDDATEEETVVDVNLGYTTAWQLPAEV